MTHGKTEYTPVLVHLPEKLNAAYLRGLAFMCGSEAMRRYELLLSDNKADDGAESARVEARAYSRAHKALADLATTIERMAR